MKMKLHLHLFRLKSQDGVPEIYSASVCRASHMDRDRQMKIFLNPRFTFHRKNRETLTMFDVQTEST